MNRAMFEDHLAATERELAEVEHHVAYQRELVALLRHDGHDAGQAAWLLKQFEEVLAMHITARDWARQALGLKTSRRKSRPSLLSSKRSDPF